MADIILSRVTEKSQSDGTEKILIEYQDDIYRMPLSEIVNNSGSSESVLIDDTLTLSGYAADAAAAGDRISTVEDLISDGLAYVGDGVNDATTPINADTLGGKDLSYFAQKSDIKPKAGFIYPLATPNVPDGFLLCDGKAYSRTEYVELFAAIGTYYGDGDGSTTFNVPNLQTRVPVGAGDGYELGSVGGEETHILTKNEMPNHQHNINYGGNSGTVEFPAYSAKITDYVQAAGNYNAATTTYEGGNQPHNNMQPYTVINYIISTGKESAVYIRDVINGAQAIPLEVQYGGTGALNADDARKNLGIREYKRNLLDNSDFTNPVNQRGQSVYSFDSGYTIDRWRLHWTGDDGSLTVNNGYITLTRPVHLAYLFQNIPLEMNLIGKTVTVAAKVRGKGKVGFCFNDGTLREHTVFDSSEWHIVTKTITIPPYDYSSASLNGVELSTNTDSTAHFEWAALYEGEYTADTLPPYVPKGYAAELAECKRYCQIIPFTITKRTSNYDETYYFNAMRTTPTATIYSINGVAGKASYYTGDWVDMDIIITIWNERFGGSIRLYASEHQNCNFGFSKIGLSADL